MLSKLTFSLVFVLMLALVAGPAFAQDVANVPAKQAFTVFSETAAGADPNLNGLPTGGSITTAALPDLYDILANGGSIELSILQQGVAANGTPATGTFSVAHDATDRILRS